MKSVACCLAATLTVLVSGCGTNVSSSYRPSIAGGKGLIVGTITYENFGGKYSVPTRYLQDPKVYIELAVGSSQWHPFVKINDSDLQMRGDTFAIEAPSGEYWMGTWYIQQGPKWYHGTQPIAATFKVEAGKVTYVGNIHFVAKDYVNLQDMSKRDMPIIEARFPGVKGALMAYTIAEGTKLEKLGGETSWGMKPIVPLFIHVAPR